MTDDELENWASLIYTAMEYLTWQDEYVDKPVLTAMHAFASELRREIALAITERLAMEDAATDIGVEA